MRALFVASWLLTLASPILFVLLVRICCWAAGAQLHGEGSFFAVIGGLVVGVVVSLGRLMSREI
jgi:hypothetical protein